MGHDNVDRGPMDSEYDFPQKLAGRRIDPVCVLDHEQHGGSFGGEEDAICESA